MTDNEKRLTRELAEERKLVKALAEVADEMIAQKAKEDGKFAASGSKYYETKAIADAIAKVRDEATLEDAMLDAFAQPQQGYADVTTLMIDGLTEAAKERRKK